MCFRTKSRSASSATSLRRAIGAWPPERCSAPSASAHMHLESSGCTLALPAGAEHAPPDPWTLRQQWGLSTLPSVLVLLLASGRHTQSQPCAVCSPRSCGSNPPSLYCQQLLGQEYRRCREVLGIACNCLSAAQSCMSRRRAWRAMVVDWPVDLDAPAWLTDAQRLWLETARWRSAQPGSRRTGNSWESQRRKCATPVCG